MFVKTKNKMATQNGLLFNTFPGRTPIASPHQVHGKEAYNQSSIAQFMEHSDIGLLIHFLESYLNAAMLIPSIASCLFGLKKCFPFVFWPKNAQPPIQPHLPTFFVEDVLSLIHKNHNLLLFSSCVFKYLEKSSQYSLRKQDLNLYF